MRLLATLAFALFFMSPASALPERFSESCGLSFSQCTVTEVGDAKVTAAHCLSECSRDKAYRSDPFLDLVVLQEGDPGKCSDPSVGDSVFAGGWRGNSFSIRSGTVSELQETYPVGRRDVSKLVIQSDNRVEPGFSGGPLKNSEGEVVGMVYARGVNERFASALAISEVCRFLRDRP